MQHPTTGRSGHASRAGPRHRAPARFVFIFRVLPPCRLPARLSAPPRMRPALVILQEPAIGN